MDLAFEVTETFAFLRAVHSHKK